MSPEVKPPTQAEIEEALKKSHSATSQVSTQEVGNSEIGAALAQFEKEQGGVASPVVKDTVDVMSSQKIELRDDIDVPKMVQKVIKWSGGAIKNQKQAEYILLVVVVIFMSISLYLFFGFPSFNSISNQKRIDYMLYPELDPGRPR